MFRAVRIVVLLCLLGGAVFLFVLATRGRVFDVANEGMAPEMARGDRVYMDCRAYTSTGPARGDIVCFRGEGLPTLVRSGEWQVKRVVGLPGDTVSVRGGKFYVGEKPAPELAGIHYDLMQFDNYLTDDTSTYTVPPGSYFVLGDNPNRSYDSRFFGPVSLDRIKGKAVWRVWPLSHVGGMK